MSGSNVYTQRRLLELSFSVKHTDARLVLGSKQLSGSSRLVLTKHPAHGRGLATSFTCESVEVGTFSSTMRQTRRSVVSGMWCKSLPRDQICYGDNMKSS